VYIVGRTAESVTNFHCHAESSADSCVAKKHISSIFRTKGTGSKVTMKSQFHQP